MNLKDKNWDWRKITKDDNSQNVFSEKRTGVLINGKRARIGSGAWKTDCGWKTAFSFSNVESTLQIDTIAL